MKVSVSLVSIASITIMRRLPEVFIILSFKVTGTILIGFTVFVEAGSTACIDADLPVLT